MTKVLLALFFVIILVIPGVTWFVAQRPVPVLEGVAEIDGMQKPVLVSYDARAIPYIKAESDEDLYAAQGFVVARERFFQMEMLRRAAEGRIAQVYGIQTLPTDRLMRTIGFERMAREELKNLSPEAKIALSAYTRGVNAYLKQNADKLPLEFFILSFKPEPWREIDSLAVMKYLAYELDQSWKLDELRWRVTNKVGDFLEAKLFDDNLSVSAWSPEIRASASEAVSPAAAGSKAATTAGEAVSPAKKTKPVHSGTARTGGLQYRRPSANSEGTPSPQRKIPSEAPEPDLDQVPGAWQTAPGIHLNQDLEKRLTLLARQTEFLRAVDRSWGSTAFVLSPSFSKSGGALMAADKHSALTTPCEYFLCSLISNNLHVAGATLPGVPGIMFGRNQQVSWSSASMHADVQDLFVEHFTSGMESKYKTLAKLETAEEFHEAIPIRFGKDVDHKITITRHGPVLLRDQESGIALSWTGFETKRPWLNSVCALNRANSWESFCQAITSFGGPPQLFVFADKKGNVGCHAAGIIPVRAGGAQGTTMSEGWLSKGEWVSSFAFDELPQSFMPAGTSGRVGGDFCIAAGQKLNAASGGGHPGQLWGHQWDCPYRANRLALSLPRSRNPQKLDLLDFNAYQGDNLNMLAGLVVSELKKAMDANKSIDATQMKAMNLMQHWDYSIKPDSAAATCYESFMGTLARRLIEPKLGRDMTNEYFQNWPLWTTLVEDYLRHKPKELLPSEERTTETFLIDTFSKANTRLKLLFKNDNVETWTWEKAHEASFRSVGLWRLSWLLRYLLDIHGIGVGGDSNCLNACDVDRLSVSGVFRSNNGPSVRLLVDMSDDDAFYGNLALGQSGHYLSGYRRDQLRSWLRTDPLPIAFSDAQIEKQARQKFYISPPTFK